MRRSWTTTSCYYSSTTRQLRQPIPHLPESEFPVAMFSSIQLWTTIVVLVLAPLFFGSVDLFWIAVWAILLSISVMCGAAAPMDTGQSRILFGFVALCGVYAL